MFWNTRDWIQSEHAQVWQSGDKSISLDPCSRECRAKQSSPDVPLPNGILELIQGDPGPDGTCNPSSAWIWVCLGVPSLVDLPRNPLIAVFLASGSRALCGCVSELFYFPFCSCTAHDCSWRLVSSPGALSSTCLYPSPSCLRSWTLDEPPHGRTDVQPESPFEMIFCVWIVHTFDRSFSSLFWIVFH